MIMDAMCEKYECFNRVMRITGRETFNKICETRVIVFGIGGVGSWCAESLIRSGIMHLTIVDADVVAASNINRQLPATTSTVGLPKVDVMKTRLLDINPHAHITAINDVYNERTAEKFNLESYDYIVDAIDSLSDKAHLILKATSTNAKFVSSMGAALKVDPTAIKMAEFWKVKGCPLAASLRRKFKKSGIYPKRKFKCVYSDEQPMKNDDTCVDLTGAMSFNKVSINGAICHTTAIFGLYLAAFVFNHIIGREK